MVGIRAKTQFYGDSFHKKITMSNPAVAQQKGKVQGLSYPAFLTKSLCKIFYK
jgi:hypothetical protein